MTRVGLASYGRLLQMLANQEKSQKINKIVSDPSAVLLGTHSPHNSNTADILDSLWESLVHKTYNTQVKM